MRGTIAPLAIALGAPSLLVMVACSSSSNGARAGDASTDTVAPSGDAGAEASVTGMTIASIAGGPLQGAAGDALRLQVVVTLSDGTTGPLPASAVVDWTAPQTVTAQDPTNPPAGSVLPDAGAAPTGIFVTNPYRSSPVSTSGVLYLINAGDPPGGAITVTATVADAGAIGDGGPLTATVQVLPTPDGDPDAGAALYTSTFACGDCHGATGDGTPPIKTDAGIIYMIKNSSYPYPAPGLNDTTPKKGSPNLAADPTWNAALLGMAAQGDLDNGGVALRVPMPAWLGKPGLDGGPAGAQEYADIYAFLKTQTK